MPSSRSDVHPAAPIETAERLRLATEAADMFAWDVDIIENLVTWAPNASRVIGCTQDQLVREPSKSTFFVDAADRPLLTRKFNQAIKSGKDQFFFEFRGNGGPDRLFWHVHATFVRNDSGEVIRIVGATQNVTRQKTYSDNLKLATERLTMAEQASGAFLHDWNIVNDTTWRSSGLTRMLGWLPEDLEAGSFDWTELRHPDDRQKMMTVADLERDLIDDRYAQEYRLLHKDGNYVWVLDAGMAHRNATGKIVRIAGTTVDITSRKKAEASQNRQRNLIDLSFEPIFVWHPEKGIVDWNKGAELLYGYSKAEAIGQSSHRLLQTKAQHSPDELIKILLRDKIWTGVLEHKSKSGTRIFVESRHQAFYDDGELLILETNHDISQRQLADTYTARMAAVALAAHDALFGITLDGHVQTWNPGAEKLFGYSSIEMIGHHVSILADASRHDEQRDLMRRAQFDETVGPYEARRLRKDGSFVDVSVSIAPVRGVNGTLLSLSVAVHDITEQKEWEARQRLMTRELAHRIKNSFAVLQGILRSTLRMSRSPKEFADAFSGRLQSLAAAQDILTENDWRGAELGALAKIQLAAYVDEQDHRVDMAGPSVNLPADLAAPFGLVFNELATNAIKYGALSVPGGSVFVSWRTERDLNRNVRLFLMWRERGGPTPTPPAPTGPRGFGSSLIERSLAGADVAMTYEPDGLVCSIEIPIPATKNRHSKKN